jgi:hypothetical protein
MNLVMMMMVASMRLWRQLGEKGENLVYHLGIPKREALLYDSSDVLCPRVGI